MSVNTLEYITLSSLLETKHLEVFCFFFSTNGTEAAGGLSF